MKTRNAILTIINLITAFFIFISDYFRFFLIIRLLLYFCIALTIFYLWAFLNDENKLYEKKKLFLIIGIINLICLKFVTGTLTLINYNKLKKYNNYVPSKKINPHIKKLDKMLKILVLSTFFICFFLINYNWYILSFGVKIFLLLLASILLILLSKYSEKKIKINTTVYLYWFLGLGILFILSSMIIDEIFYMLFLSSDIVFYNLDFFTYLVDLSKYLVLFFLFLISYYKFKSKNILYFIYLLLTFILFFLLSWFIL